MELESIRTFDAETQRTTGNVKQIALAPMSEVLLSEEGIKRFRRNYTAAFGGATVDDPLYAAVSAGQRFAGVEHRLPFFYTRCSGWPITSTARRSYDDQAREAFAERQGQIKDYHQAREEARTRGATAGAPYKPIEPGLLYELNATGAVADGGSHPSSPFASSY